jgi:hypothetical protein
MAGWSEGAAVSAAKAKGAQLRAKAMATRITNFFIASLLVKTTVNSFVLALVEV